MADDLIGCKAAHTFVGWADVSKNEIAIGFPDDILHIFGEQAEVGFAALQPFLGQVLLERDAGQAGTLLDQVNVLIGRRVCRAVVEGFALALVGAAVDLEREDGLRPASTQSGAGGQRKIRRPVGVRRDVLDDHALAGKGGRAARPGTHSDGKSVESFVVEVRQAGCDAAFEPFPIVVEQQDAAQHRGIQLLHTKHQCLKNVWKRLASGQHFKDMAAELIVPFGAFCLADAIWCQFRLGTHEQPDTVTHAWAIDAHHDIVDGLACSNGLRRRMLGGKER